MSGHSKWHQIRRQKGITDAKRGNMFTKAARLITVAAQKGGGDPGMNALLRTALESAKQINMPSANIERAIKKGTGELKEGLTLAEVVYEGYGPGGIALYIQAVTDNKNRAVAEVKNILSKHGGSMGSAGCTAWMFEQKGIISFDVQGKDLEEIELQAIEACADDIKFEGSTLFVYTAPQNFQSIKETLNCFGITSSGVTFVAKNEVKITDETTARQILRLINALEDCDDVSGVASNFDIAEEVLRSL